MIRRFAEHRVAANLAMVMMVLAGWWTLENIPSMLDPPMHVPVVWVEVEWRGAAAEDVEELVTRPIELTLRTLNDLRELSSYTANGYVRVSVEFEYDADMVIALDQVKQRVATIRNLPADIEPPTVSRFIDLEPVATLLITGPGDVNELIPLVRSMEKELLSRGIEGVVYDGLPEEEIALLVRGQRLEELKMTLDELARDVARVSLNVPAGTIGRGQGSRQLRSLDQQRDPLGFAHLTLQHGDTLIRLGDIADVVRRPRDGQPIVTRAGEPAIEMTLMRATSADARLADRIVDGWLAETRPTLPTGVEATLYNDIWALLGAQLDMVANNALSGLVLVLVTLFAFLNGRVAAWVAWGVPVTFLFGLAIFHGVFGYGISIIALIAFIMAIGIVVDDAIIVGEDALTHFENGLSPLDAAVAGAERMFVPVVTACLTTLATFVPLVLIGGEMGDVVLTLPLVLMCVLIASLVECFIVLPGHLRASFEKLSAEKLRPPSPRNEQSFGRRMRQRFDAAFHRVRVARLMPLVRRALDYPGATLCTAAGATVCALSLVVSQHVGVNLVTGFDIETLAANVEFSASASDSQKDAFLDELEQTLVDTHQELDAANLLGWLTKRNLAEFNKQRETGVQFASVTGQYAYRETRTARPQDFAARWRDRVTAPPWVERLSIAVEGGANAGQSDIVLVLRGENLDNVKAGAEELARVLASFDGVSNVMDDLPYGKEQLIFTLTSTGRALGVTSDSLGAQLRAAYNGERVQIFNQNESELEVRVMLPDAERDDLARLQQFPIRTPAGDFVPLANVASLYNRRGIDVIRHNDAEMAIRVFANVDAEIANAFHIISEVQEKYLPQILSTHHLTFGLTGKSEQDQVIIETMSLGALLTLAFIYLILAWVFSSYVWPLAVMTAIPFGLTGAILGHWVMGEEIGAMSLLAFFCLSGIAVNDSIVLVTFLRRHLADGHPLRESLERAASERFRAVLLTSLTTIAGLLPLLFTKSSLDFYLAPIAITICFGLTFSTLLVLVVVPALILLFEGGKQRMGRAAASLFGTSTSDPVAKEHRDDSSVRPA